MEFDSGCYVHEDIMSKAYWAKNALDRKPCYFDKSIAKNDYKSYLQEVINTPMKSKLAMQKIYSRDGIYYPEHLEANKSFLERIPSIDNLVKQIAEQDKNYPKTLSLRNKLITMNRVQLDTITPKLTGFKKLLLKLKVML